MVRTKGPPGSGLVAWSAGWTHTGRSQRLAVTQNRSLSSITTCNPPRFCYKAISGRSAGVGKEGPLKTQLVFKEIEPVARKLAQRIRGRSPLMQGKIQYIRKINKPEAWGYQGNGGLFSPGFGRELPGSDALSLSLYT